MSEKPPHKNKAPHKGKPPYKGKSPQKDKPYQRRSDGKPRPPLSPGVQSRLIIARAIQTIWGQGRTVEESLEMQEGFSDLSTRDRAFARNVVSLTFRRWAQINHVLRQYLKKEPPSFVMAILRSAVTQSLFLNTPDHAVVGETVSAMKTVKSAIGFVGMANAVLRRITETGASHLGAVPPHMNVPGWVLKQWEKDYGRMEARRIARQIIEIPPLDICTKPDIDIIETAKELKAAQLGGTSLRCEKAGHIPDLPGFKDGKWWIQDVSSALPVQILNEAAGGLNGKTVFDMCAAPGGKTMQLASFGADVTAIDKSDYRLKRLSQNLARCQMDAKIITADVLDLPDDLGQADIIVLDVPCTATGTFRRHPEVLYNRKPKDQAALMRLQGKMLNKMSKHLKPGGFLAFCTCSLQKSEGEAQIDAFLQRSPDFRLNRILTKAGLGLTTEMIGDGFLRTQPNFLSEIGGMDGFFTAILQKTG